MAKRWKSEDITYMKRYAQIRSLAELAERFKTNTATVEAKLTEIGKAARDMVVAPNLADDPNVQLFERAVKATYLEKWKEAAKMLEQVRQETDLPSLAEQARSYLSVCEERLEKTRSAADPFLEAVFLRNRGELDEALKICVRSGRASKDARFAYLAAAIHAVQGNLEKAGDFLSKAIEADSRNRVVATRDEDFESLRSDPDYSSLFVPN
jgi:tetratricopeptide (TPR) repeat protein